MNRAMESILNAAGFEAVMFFTAEALLEAGMPDEAACLLLDVHLPGMSGFELYDSLTDAGQIRPVIFMTAHDEPAARAQAEKVRAVAYLTKPFAGKNLIELVDRVTRSGTAG